MQDQAIPFPNSVPTADIHFVDFELLQNNSDEEVAKVIEASTGYGFFYLRNTQIDPECLFELANETFSLPLDEKMKYEIGASGNYFGYKVSGGSYTDAQGTPDCSEWYNISKDDILRVGKYENSPLEQPATVVHKRDYVEHFMRSCHKVSMVILEVLARQLNLDPVHLQELHNIDRTGGDLVRLTYSTPVTSESIPLGEHTDFGSVTVLFNKMGGLQVLKPGSGEWQYVRPEAGCAIINLGDALVKLVGGRLYSGVHRVLGPPGQQSQCDRQSVIYFCRPNGNVRLRSLFDGDKDTDAVTADEWILRRAKQSHSSNFQNEETYRASRGTEHHLKREELYVEHSAGGIRVT